ncbi:MAG: DUF2339 domain-containing protein [Prochlorococcus sp.]|nr:DUF2339 domain-containing protein [Prochlorococcaceae cyanobacterium Fu_MAG_50]
MQANRSDSEHDAADSDHSQSEASAQVIKGPPGLTWMRPLLSLVSRQPQRWLAAPLSVVVSCVIASSVTAGWWTLVWAIEALVLFSISIFFSDRALRIVALILLGICLIQLVGVDMRELDLALRGVVFTGVGLVMVALNVISSRLQGP